MRLDHTFIAIRERGMLEICDLSLHVVRQHFKPLILLLMVGAAPWILIDTLLTSWLLTGIFSEDYRPYFYWLTMVMVVSQAQVGTSLMTYYLGQAMFVGQLSIRDTIIGSFRTSFYFWWVHGGLRLVFPILFAVFLTWHSDENTLIGISSLLLPLLVGAALLVRATRPFVSEMLLLERTPVRMTPQNSVNLKRRSFSLHSSAGADLFGRFLVTCIMFPLLTFTLFSMFVTADTTLNLQANSDLPLLAIYWVLALWLTAGFAAVVRFLSYIDIRIRQEGWTVELKMRAEGQRLNNAIQKLLLLVAAAGLLLAHPDKVAAQDGVENTERVFNQRTYPWYDAETGEIRPIEFGERAPAKSSDRNEIPLGVKPPTKTGGGGGGGNAVNSGLSGVAWVVLGLLIAALTWLMIWAFFRIESSSRRSATGVAPRSLTESIKHLPFELAEKSGDFRSLAQQAAAAGDYRRAAIYLFSHVLVTLDQTDLIRLRKGKTNRQYLFELRRHALLADFYRQVMELFEAGFFGDHNLTRDEFEPCWKDLEQFENGINQTITVPS